MYFICDFTLSYAIIIMNATIDFFLYSIDKENIIVLLISVGTVLDRL